MPSPHRERGGEAVGLLKRKNSRKAGCFSGVQTAQGINTVRHPFRAIDGYVPLKTAEHTLYAALREAVPIIDAAILKTVRLTGDFTVECDSPYVQREINAFLKTVKVGGCSSGITAFLSAYLDQMLTYGTAAGEIVPCSDGRSIGALYNASLEGIELRAEKNPLNVTVCMKSASGESVPVPNQELILVTPLNPEPGSLCGTSILKGLPFVGGILLKIFNSLGVNWERVGNIRFAVTYKPPGDMSERAFTRERAQQIAEQWGKAMRDGGQVSDFVSVGDVSIKVIGADNQVLDSEVPVRQLLEQIIAKLSIPPFLLGLSWSSTERMSSQQADILTSELEYYRNLLTPVIEKICGLWMRMNGYDGEFEICWNNINLQDETQLANARLLNAQALQLEEQAEGEQNEAGTDFKERNTQ